MIKTKKASSIIISVVVNVLYGLISLFFVLSFFLDSMFDYIHLFNFQTSFSKVYLSFLGTILINFVMRYIFRKKSKENKVRYWSINLTIAFTPYILFLIGLLLPTLL